MNPAIMNDPYLLVRAASLYLAIVPTGVAWIWRRPSPRVATAAMLAIFWNLPALLIVNLVAIRLGWWQYDARGGLLLGIPVDLFLSWAWLWGGLPIVAAPSAPMLAVTGTAASLVSTGVAQSASRNLSATVQALRASVSGRTMRNSSPP